MHSAERSHDLFIDRRSYKDKPTWKQVANVVDVFDPYQQNMCLIHMYKLLLLGGRTTFSTNSWLSSRPI